MITLVHAAFYVTVKKCDFRNGPQRGKEQEPVGFGGCSRLSSPLPP
jgi:hypothetical protein